MLNCFLTLEQPEPAQRMAETYQPMESRMAQPSELEANWVDEVI